MNLDGARTLITGASSGVGAELARALADRGARLVIAARRGERLDALAEEIETHHPGRRPVVLRCDLSVPGDAERLGAAAKGELGGIDVLINNAGGGVGGLQWHVGDAGAGRQAFETNVWSPLALVRCVVPDMKSRKHGAVVNVTSAAQVVTWPMIGYYTASKAAAAMFTETLRLELTGSGVHVLEVIPGPVDTAVQGETLVIPGVAKTFRGVRLGKPTVLARRVVRALERDRRRVIYPSAMKLPFALPGSVRLLVPLQVRAFRKELEPYLSLEPELIMRSGSQGDDFARRAREAWDAGDRDLSALRDELAATVEDHRAQRSTMTAGAVPQ